MALLELVLDGSLLVPSAVTLYYSQHDATTTPKKKKYTGNNRVHFRKINSIDPFLSDGVTVRCGDSGVDWVWSFSGGSNTRVLIT